MLLNVEYSLNGHREHKDYQSMSAMRRFIKTNRLTDYALATYAEGDNRGYKVIQRGNGYKHSSEF
ncbi:hypothetical protein JL_8 [Bacillus phage JL]|uniref:Uncharacterized protein n=1 Tax=Bacillus phage JL TaxID=1296655 RepID=S5M4T5_9CAUD|nr:hypothetical protein AVV47_gp008 [Bacillus phage JL]AGR46891.1 hypothetical protein JL_8 [Bacillus phage JL]